MKNIMPMKNFLVAIDFSKTSIHVLKYTLSIANKAGGDVMMVWVDDVSTPESILTHESIPLREETIRQFEELIDDNKQLLPNGKLRYKIRKGKVYYEIAAVARSIKADIILTGTHGITGFEEYWIGSNAYRIVVNAPCPVITIRNSFDIERGIKTILIPIDRSSNTTEKLPYAAEMAEVFGAEIHILSLYSTTLKSLRQRVDIACKKASDYFSDKNLPYICNSLVADNNSSATLNYSEEKNIDMIVIMTEQEATKSNVFLGQDAQQMVNNSNVPVFNVHPNEKSMK